MNHPYKTIHEFWNKIDRLAVTTHCGYIGRFPENSMRGLEAAVALGTDFIEFDLRGTSDNKIVLLHDPTIDRISNGSGPVKSFTLTELQKFNLSYWQYFIDCSGRKLKEPRYPQWQISTFEEVIEKFSGQVFMNIQVYAEDPKDQEIICGMFKEANLYEKAYLTMRDYQEANFIRSIDPDIELCVLNRPAPTNIAALHTMKDYGCRVAQPRWLDMTPEYCDASRELGIFSNVYYANLHRDIAKYDEMGVQGILTDYAENLISYVKEKYGA
ncbi:MAG: hypothetical protein IJW17_14725 [Lentisphaeria bacterium]|nr:hypothetical protein [Lentisphaeria bacterium]